MQKTVVKSLGIFILVFFVLSTTGAAATCNSPSCKGAAATCNSPSCKMDARDDVFTLNSCKTTKCFNVLSNDIGAGKKVTTTGTITTAKGGKVTMKSNGVFCYTKPVACSKVSDSFTYTAVNKYGKKDTAKVTLKFKCSSCSSCTSCKCSSCTACTTCTSSSCASCK